MTLISKLGAGVIAAYSIIGLYENENFASLKGIAYCSEAQVQQQSVQSKEQKETEKRKIPYSEIKRVLGKRLEGIAKKDNSFINNWDKITEEDFKKKIYETYRDYNEEYKRYSKEEKKEYDEFKTKFKKTDKNRYRPEKFDNSELEEFDEFEKGLGWRIFTKNKELEESDIMVFFNIFQALKKASIPIF